MKAAVLGRESVRIVERELPELRPGSVRVAVEAVGICGTDLHLYHGLLGSAEGLQPGHEVAGMVEAVGDGVALATGTHVAVEPIAACGECFHCRTGYPNRCAMRRLFGVTARGGMAEYLVVPAGCLHELPPRLSKSAAALSEPMAVCVRGARLAGIGAGDRVVVLGAGTIGLLSVLTARAAGAQDVVVTARYPHQAELARALGASAVFGSVADLMAAGGGEADAVIETVGGRADTVTEAVEAARTGGVIVMLGVFEGAVGVPGLPFSSKELRLIGSNCYARAERVGDFALATRLVAKHEAELAPVVTHRFKLDEVARAYATAADKRQGSIKVQVEP